MIVYTAMSPKAIEREGWTGKVNALLLEPEAYRKTEADEFTGGKLFPPPVTKRLANQLREQAKENSSLWGEIRWSARYLEDADVVYFRLMVE